MTKILVTEDDRFLASAYRLKLSKSNFEVQIAGDGEDALEQLKTFKPDIILLDLVMPRRDGFSVLEEVRKQEEFKLVPIVVASNLGQKEDIDKAKSLGATDFIIKSDFSLEDIINKINDTLAKAQKPGT